MPVFKYSNEVEVDDTENVRLRIEFPDNGTAAHHNIDLPGNHDRDAINEYSDVIGNGKDLKAERTIIYTKAANMDPDNDMVRVNYYINDQLVAQHSGPKSADPSQQIKVTLIFK